MINPHPLEAADEDLLIEHLRQIVPQLDALIIADYIPGGVVSPRVSEALLELAERNPQGFSWQIPANGSPISNRW